MNKDTTRADKILMHQLREARSNKDISVTDLAKPVRKAFEVLIEEEILKAQLKLIGELAQAKAISLQHQEHWFAQISDELAQLQELGDNHAKAK